MKTKTFWQLAMAMVLGILLAACGGGGGGDNTQSTTQPPQQGAPSPTAATLNIAPGQITYTPRIVGDNIVNLIKVREREQEDISLGKVGAVFWVRSSGVRIQGSFNQQNGVVIVGGLSPIEEGVLVFVRNDDGRELEIDTSPNKLFRTGISSSIVANRFIRFGDVDGTSIPSVSASPKTRVNITTASGLVEILPAYADGRITGLVISNPTERVLDSSGKVIAGYRIAWNDGNRWYPAANIAVPLSLPKTSIAGAAQPSGFGAGMPYLIRPDGSFISWNTTTCEVFVNGVQVMPSSDGLFHY